MKGEALKGHLDLLLLAALAAGVAHGYAIITALRERSGGTFDLPEGTIYPALHRLERAGFIAGRWQDTANGIRRRYYQITVRGRQALMDRLQEWQRFSRAMDSIMLPDSSLTQG